MLSVLRIALWQLRLAGKGLLPGHGGCWVLWEKEGDSGCQDSGCLMWVKGEETNACAEKRGSYRAKTSERADRAAPSSQSWTSARRESPAAPSSASTMRGGTSVPAKPGSSPTPTAAPATVSALVPSVGPN